MDPQQRLLLEVAWEALEHAGIAPDGSTAARAACLSGISNSDYMRMLASDPEQIDTYLATGNASSIAAGRLSYVLGLQGPAMALDTACSSSLVAVHLAVQSLRSGECDLALAGGVNLILTPEITINFSKARMMAPGRPLQDVRRQRRRLRARRGLRRRGAQAPLRRAGRRRPGPGGDPRLRREPGRAQRRPDGARTAPRRRR